MDRRPARGRRDPPARTGAPGSGLGPGRAADLRFGSRPAVGEGGPGRLRARDRGDRAARRRRSGHRAAGGRRRSCGSGGSSPSTSTARRWPRSVTTRSSGRRRCPGWPRSSACSRRTSTRSGSPAWPPRRWIGSPPRSRRSSPTTTCCASAGRAGCRAPKPRRSGVECRPSSDACRDLAASGVPGQPGAWRPCRRRGHPGTDGPGLPRLVGRVDHPSVPVRGLAPPIQRRDGRRCGPARRGVPGPVAGERPVTAADGRRALDLARIVLPLHLAAMYSERILPGLEQPDEVGHVVPDALRTILPG